jgi:RNA polymerase sigma factor (sigma-70 family)
VRRPLSADRSPPPRERAAVALLARSAQTFRRTARRYSLCGDDADDAYARAVEILLTKAPATDEEHLIRWMQVVTRREALALRRARERLLGGRTEVGDELLPGMPCPRPGPAERAEQRERLIEIARAINGLKPQERRALLLRAQGYSYAEIRGLTGWTYTKVNRCLAEGRARLRELTRST